jgi:hypothetical protein
MHRDQTHLRDIGLTYAQVNLLARNSPSKATLATELEPNPLPFFFLFSEIKETYKEELNSYLSQFKRIFHLEKRTNSGICKVGRMKKTSLSPSSHSLSMSKAGGLI